MKALRADERLWMVRIDRGEEIVASLLSFAKERDVQCAAVTGLGGVEAVRIAYFDTQRKEYLPRDVEGVLELVSLVGNLAREGDAPFLHAHVVVSDRDFRCYGGHLLRATVAVTAEFAVHPGRAPLARIFDPALGVKRQEFGDTRGTVA